MARRGQVGHIEVSGKYYVVRFWHYPPEGKRILRKEKICPISGHGYLPRGERRRRALEIIEEAGVNSAQQFNDAHVETTFQEQAEWFFNHVEQRKRSPVKPKTLETWRYTASKWLYPALGDLPLGTVSNATVKPLVGKMQEAGLSAKSIHSYIGLVKLVVASKVDGDGEQMFPRKWNHEFLDMPIVAGQHRPTFTAEAAARIVGAAAGQDRVLFALLAGTGLRIGEALGLEIRHFTPDCRTITVEQSVWKGQIQTPKTLNAYRQVDLCPALAELLRASIRDRRDGLVFANRQGKPLSQTNLLHRLLYPILEKLGVEKCGFHAMRRFRVTWLRKKRVPEDLIRFWIGHADKTVTDGYSQLREDAEYRRIVAEQTGLGFDLPDTLIPVIPSAVVQEAVEIEC
jgi:integrase